MEISIIYREPYTGRTDVIKKNLEGIQDIENEHDCVRYFRNVILEDGITIPTPTKKTMIVISPYYIYGMEVAKD